MKKIGITVAEGDGIGPEIMKAVLKILDAAGAPLEYHFIEIGEKVYRSGITNGISDEAWEILKQDKIFLKAPITTPQGGGYKSLNVTIRKSFGLFANVRPVKAYAPYVKSNFPLLDLIIVRENEEDLYAGIEHQQTNEVIQALKLISKPGTEKIVRYAFEFAKANNRKKVTCMTKDNIMKHTDGTFHKIFDKVALEYPEMQTEHMIIDIGSAKLAAAPERFDVVVTLNLYGDVISDIVAEVAGSVGLCGSSNIGEHMGMFEAIHGSAPDIAGRDIANPSGLLNGAIMMLVHLGLNKEAALIENAWLKTLEDGIHTGDVYREGFSTKKVGTMAFADAVIERLGKTPEKLPVVDYGEGGKRIELKPLTLNTRTEKKMVGVDVFMDWNESERNPDVLGKALEACNTEKIKLKMITNRGVKVYPQGMKETYKTDHWRCRFTNPEENALTNADVLALLNNIHAQQLDFVKTEHLYYFGGERAYSLGQGE